jgi:hypothetical protein
MSLKLVKSTRPRRQKAQKMGRRVETIPASNIRTTKIPGPGEKHMIQSFTRWIDGGAVYPQTSSVGTSYVFKLSLIPGYAEIAAMWDFYRITKVDVLYAPASKAGPSTATTTSPGTVMAAGPDYDESTAVNFTTMLERQDTAVYSVFDSWEVSFKPRAASVVYGNGVTSGYALAPADQWMDTSADVSYYGFNYAFPATAAANQFGGRIMYRLHLECAKVI